jgi:hypothetical protein
MPIEAASMEQATAVDRIHMALVGPGKSGKSRLAATAREPVLFIDADNRRESLAGIKGVYALTIMDSLESGRQPTAYNDMLTLATHIEQGKTLKTIGEIYGAQGWPDVRPRTLVDDSLFSIARCASNYILYTNKDIRREMVVVGGKLQIRGSRDFWNFEIPAVENLIFRQLAIKDLDLIVIYHEQPEEAPNSTEDRKILTGRIDVYPGRYRNLLLNFNEVWRITREKIVPTVQVLPDQRFSASTTLDFSKVTPDKFVPNIKRMIELGAGKVQ